MALVDDQTIVSAVGNLPSLALPPISGLLVLLFGYIVLVGTGELPGAASGSTGASGRGSRSRR